MSDVDIIFSNHQDITEILLKAALNTNKQCNFESLLEHLDLIPQTSDKFQSQLNTKCNYIECTFQVMLSAN